MMVSLTLKSRSPAIRYRPSSLTITKRAASLLRFSRLRCTTLGAHLQM
uniref:Uncharacterized protein n=1 Tax=Setaria italica TaxID=4555 RepID=K3YNL2_SETIT